MICPACQQEVGDTGLGTPLPHHLESSEGFCPGFIRPEPATYPVGPLDTFAAERAADALRKAIKEPGRKVRSDKGTKRGQRKKGGDSHVSTDRQTPGGEQRSSSTVGPQAAPGGPPSQEPERVAARPPTKVEDWMNSKITSAVLDSTSDLFMVDRPKPRGDPAPAAPRVGYVATAPDWQPLIHATYAEADDAATEALRGAAERVIIYRVTPVEEISNGLIRKRLGRVRKAKP